MVPYGFYFYPFETELKEPTSNYEFNEIMRKKVSLCLAILNHKISFGEGSSFTEELLYGNIIYSFSMALSGLLQTLLLIQCTCMLANCFNCPNRHFCHLQEIKYRAFSALTGSYLNSTGYIIQTFQETNALNCKRTCVATPGCQSTNHYIGFNTSDMFCDLMRGNRWSNASSLIQRASSTHYFIQVRGHFFLIKSYV